MRSPSPACCSLPAAVAADKVTVLLRSGEKVAGDLEDLNQGTLFVRVSLNDQRKLPIGDVAVIDFVGGASGLPESELSQARGDDHLLVLRTARSCPGVSSTSPGVRDPTVPTKPGCSSSGRPAAKSVACRWPRSDASTWAGTRQRRPDDCLPTREGVQVAANQGWVATGVYVARGQQVTFGTQGEVQLSGDANDLATAAGAKSGRRAAGAPMPGVLAGALIGRIGPNGTPFGIGDQTTAIPMPDAGELFLAVNDDDRNDNQGAFAVTVTPSPVVAAASAAPLASGRHTYEQRLWLGREGERCRPRPASRRRRAAGRRAVTSPPRYAPERYTRRAPHRSTREQAPAMSKQAWQRHVGHHHHIEPPIVEPRVRRDTGAVAVLLAVGHRHDVGLGARTSPCRRGGREGARAVRAQLGGAGANVGDESRAACRPSR